MSDGPARDAEHAAQPRPRRAYRSPRREQQAADTRALVLEAATRLFSERGWAGTGMRAIAEEAGVSMVPLYAHFGSKGDLLLAAIDVGVVGDADAVPLADRPEFAALGVGTWPERAAAVARMLTAINDRGWRLRRALVEAAAGDADLADRLRDLEARRRADIRDGLEMAAGRAIDDDVLDALWALLGAETFELLTQHGRRSTQEYERWVAVIVQALVPA